LHQASERKITIKFAGIIIIIIITIVINYDQTNNQQITQQKI